MTALAVRPPLSSGLDRLFQQPEPSPSAVTTRDLGDARAAASGDDDAFRRLVERHQTAVAGWLMRFTRERLALEELVQDVFVEAHANLRQFRGESPFGTWLRTVATRVGYRHWKRLRRAQATERLGDRQLAAADRASAEEAADLVHTMLSRLPPRDRLVLTLTYLHGCSVQEAAAHAGWSVAMVKVQAHRARKKLHRLLLEGGA